MNQYTLQRSSNKGILVPPTVATYHSNQSGKLIADLFLTRFLVPPFCQPKPFWNRRSVARQIILKPRVGHDAFPPANTHKIDFLSSSSKPPGSPGSPGRAVVVCLQVTQTIAHSISGRPNVTSTTVPRETSSWTSKGLKYASPLAWWSNLARRRMEKSNRFMSWQSKSNSRNDYEVNRGFLINMFARQLLGSSFLGGSLQIYLQLLMDNAFCYETKWKIPNKIFLALFF